MKDAVPGELLDDRHLEKFEQAQGPFVARRDLPANKKRVGRAVAGQEGDQAITVQIAILGRQHLPNGFVRLSDGVRPTRWDDDHAVRRERSPRSLADPQAACSTQDVMNRDRIEGIEGEPPTVLDLADRKGVEAHR